MNDKFENRRFDGADRRRSRIEFDVPDEGRTRELIEFFNDTPKSVAELTAALEKVNTLDDLENYLRQVEQVPTGQWSRSTESMVRSLAEIKTEILATEPSKRREVANRLIIEHGEAFPSQGNLNATFNLMVLDFADAAPRAKESGRPATMEDVKRRVSDVQDLDEYIALLEDFQVIPLGNWGKRTEDIVRSLRKLNAKLKDLKISDNLDAVETEINQNLALVPEDGDLKAKLLQVINLLTQHISKGEYRNYQSGDSAAA